MIQQIGESLESRWYREHSIKAHRRHLKEISLRSKSTIRSTEHTKIVNLRKLSQEFDKQREIERENFILFIKLNTIKERKISPRDSYGPKSLNLSTRKKEAERIMNENYGYVKRFIEMPSFVSARKQIKDYQAQQCYKKTISKANLHKRLVKLSSFVAKPGHLPPLDLSAGRSEDQSKLEILDENIEKVGVKEAETYADNEKVGVKETEQEKKVGVTETEQDKKVGVTGTEQVNNKEKVGVKEAKEVFNNEKVGVKDIEEDQKNQKEKKVKENEAGNNVKEINVDETQILSKVLNENDYEKEEFEDEVEELIEDKGGELNEEIKESEEKVSLGPELKDAEDPGVNNNLA